MDVSKNRGTPKWMVYNEKPYEQMDDLVGVFPLIMFGNTQAFYEVKSSTPRWFNPFDSAINGLK